MEFRSSYEPTVVRFCQQHRQVDPAISVLKAIEFQTTKVPTKRPGEFASGYLGVSIHLAPLKWMVYMEKPSIYIYRYKWLILGYPHIRKHLADRQRKKKTHRSEKLVSHHVNMMFIIYKWACFYILTRSGRLGPSCLR